MRLKRLEISGFKTFREKVVLEFSPGVSGIIGPNGCGKSNIIDAIRWVMGEQRVKAIRGKKMDDVIFSGSETAPPVGMAEVTMAMVSDGQPFAGAYGECHEVTVARRIFREGESEYYLNKVPCRLLDIKEFFMDTGVGTRTYSLVEQNSVSTLVEAKPEDRRQFIEEAAGIAKYKSRKEAALRKLEATTQNLTRLHDIIKEVKTQLNAVSRQAKRAEQYRTLKKEIKDAELTLGLIAYADLSEKRAAREKERAYLQEQETTLRTILKGQEASCQDMKVNAMEAEEIIARSREKLSEAKNNIAMREQALEFSRKRIADLRALKERGVCEMAAREERLTDMQKELEFLRSQNEKLERESQELKAALPVGQQKLEELKQAEINFFKELETRKGAYVDIAAEKAKLKNMGANLVKALEDINRRQERHLKEIAESAARSEYLLASLENINSTLINYQEESEALKQRQGVLVEELGEAKSLLGKLEESIASCKDQRGRKSARLASLLEFQEGYSWCSDGIKTLMKAQKQGKIKERAGGDIALGLVADHIDVAREYEAAVESVLGEKLQYMVVRNHDDGVNAIDYLKQSAAGRGSFIPLEVRNNYQSQPLTKQLGGAVRLLDYVRVEDDFKEVMAYLLGDVLLIPDLKTGLSLWRQNGFYGSFVTPEGDIINPQGILTGGSRAKGERGLLANKREIGELRRETARLIQDLEKAEDNREKAALIITSSEERLQQIKAELHQVELQMNSARKDRERFEDELKRLNQRRGVMEFDHDTAVLAEAEAGEKMDGVKEGLLIQDKREMAVSKEIAGLNTKLASVKVKLEGCERDYTASKVLLASREEKAAAGRKAVAGLESARAVLRKEINDKQADQEEAVYQEAALIKQNTEDTEIVAGLYLELELFEKTLTDLRCRQQGEEDLRKGKERELKETNQNLEKTMREVSEREIALREIIFQMGALKSSQQERHSVDLEELSRDFKGIAPGEKERLLEKLDKARAALENFGEVNLLAVNEYEQLKERYDFLAVQEADVTASLHSLQRTIERINSISRTRFAETFAAVNHCFREMFARIFPGGKGHLYLTDSSELLETGVEMDIQVPGKRARSVTLLSGGEKSLAAIALIFAILQYRPTPFLVLDEVDAALDDANISLFNALIRDIAKNSQVIMVTHNKVTMEVAENLYGVTTHNQGVSTIVSVNLN